MRIKAIHEKTVQLQGNIANAVVDFSQHTVSLVAVVSDQVRNGKAVAGLAFNSIGRFAQGGIMRERMIPRLIEADPASLLDPTGSCFDPDIVSATVMRDEKPGGHGDRAGAAAALELAFWDLNAKLVDEPAYQHIAKTLSQPPNTEGAPVYAAGGYYYPGESNQRLAAELQSYQDQGYQAFKIKIGGTNLAEDMARIETAIRVAGAASAVAVDANGRFDLSTALAYGKEIAPYNLRWYEEPGDPLDFDLLAELGEHYRGSIATGENLFSAADTQNLIRYARLRPGKDILQMDPGLSYGLSEYQKILQLTTDAGFARTQCIPHGGHLINLHIVTALGLGGCEAYPGVFNPFGGYSAQSRVQDGRVFPSDAPGFGLEQKAELAPHIDNLLGA
jgi:D(-)-tartrate dehydratase